MSKRGKNTKDHGQLSLFPEEVPKWLLKEHDPVCDPYRGKTNSEGCLPDSYDDSDELAQFSDWLKRKGQ